MSKLAKKYLNIFLALILCFCMILFTGCDADIELDNGNDDDLNSPSEDNPNIPVDEESVFGKDVIVLTEDNSGTYIDYDGSEMDFNDVIDRQLSMIATEIINRLCKVYGNGTVDSNFKIKDSLIYTNWEGNKAASDRYYVRGLPEENPTIYFVPMYDSPLENTAGANLLVNEFGTLNYTPSDNDEVVYIIEDGVNYPCVYYVVENGYTNMTTISEGINNPFEMSTMILNAYLIDGNVGHSEDIKNLRNPHTAIQGNRYTYTGGSEITFSRSSSDAWDYYKSINNIPDNSTEDSLFADVAIPRLKYALAKIAESSGKVDPSTLSQFPTDLDTQYRDTLNNISYVANYIEFFGDKISEYVLECVIGEANKDTEIKQSFDSLLDDIKTFEDTIDAICNMSEYSDNIAFIRDDTFSLKNYSTDVNSLKFRTDLGNVNGRNYSEELDYLLGRNAYESRGETIKKLADSYISSPSENYENESYFNLYYGKYNKDGSPRDENSNLDDVGYLDSMCNYAALGYLKFPYTLDDLAKTKNYMNYSDVVDEIILTVGNQTFKENNAPVESDSTYLGHSAYCNVWRMTREDTITSMDDFESSSSPDEYMSYTPLMNYNSIIIPMLPNCSIPDLSHYDLFLAFTNEYSFAIRISIQTMDTKGEMSDKVYLNQDMTDIGFDMKMIGDEDLLDNDKEKFIVVAGGKMNSEIQGSVPNNDNNTWAAMFTLTDTIKGMTSDNESYNYNKGNIFESDISVYDKGDSENHDITYKINAFDCLVISFELYDITTGDLLQGQNKIPFGICLNIANSYTEEKA